MGLTPPVGLVDPACRRPLPPPVIRASSIAFLPLLPVLVRPRPRKMQSAACCRCPRSPYHCFRMLPRTLHERPLQVPTKKNIGYLPKKEKKEV